MNKYWNFLCVICGLLFSSVLFAGSGTATTATKPLDMPFYVGKVLPSPENANYVNKFLPLTKTVIIPGKDITSDHILVELLKKRIISRHGSVNVVEKLKDVSDADTVIMLGDHDVAKNITPPEKPQGYVISMTKQDGRNIVFLKGYDKLGLSWSVSSLIQLITTHDGIAVLAKAEITDFPEVVNRGIWCGYQKNNKSFAFTYKFSSILFPTLYLFMEDKSPEYWKKDVNNTLLKNLHEVGDYLNPLGISWFVGIRPIMGTVEQKINCASEKDIQSLYNKCSAIAKAGAGVLLLLDDHRFPRNPAEKKVFKTAREADSYLIKKIYYKLKADYPKAKLMVCPIFYWGPAAEPNYSESRDAYLRTMGELPKDIRLTWNGPHVCSNKITRADLKWETDLIKRKPDVLMFRAGPHMYRYHYLTDEVDYSSSYFDGFFASINTYYHAVSLPASGAVAAHITNYLWNPKAFTPKESITQVVEMLVGTGSFKSVDKVNKALTYFDQWGLKPSPGMAKDITTFKKKLKSLEAAYQECHKAYPAIDVWSGFKGLIMRQKNLLRSLDKLDLKQYSQASNLLKKIALKETGFTPQTGLFFSPYDLRGGHSPLYYQYRCEKRITTWVRGQGTSINKMNASFQLPDKSIAELTELVICGQDDDANKKCPIRICINNKPVFEGPNTFDRFGWSIRTFPIGKGFLKEGFNSLSIECTTKSDNAHGPPFFLVNYVVIKRH